MKASLDMRSVRALFEESTDFTVGLEEEFAIVDPETLELAHRYPELRAACDADDVLAPSVAGELIDTEIEIRSGRGETFAEAAAMQAEARTRLFALAAERDLALASTGVHPWASYLDQRIIDTPHYLRLKQDLGYVARRNNTWSTHVHVGVRGPDRAIAVCDHLRALLPPLLAVSASSPFLDGADTGLHSVRTQIFTRSFPRCGVHEPFSSWERYAAFIEQLVATGSVVESTQLWWSVRPHHVFGTVELRICDAQIRADESTSLSALIAACIVQSALDYDDGRLPPPAPGREIEENLWRAIRYGMDGEMIDFARRTLVPTIALIERVVEWCGPARELLGVEVEIPERNGAQRMRAALAAGASIEQIYRDAVDETQRTFAPKGVAG